MKQKVFKVINDYFHVKTGFKRNKIPVNDHVCVNDVFFSISTEVSQSAEDAVAGDHFRIGHEDAPPGLCS